MFMTSVQKYIWVHHSHVVCDVRLTSEYPATFLNNNRIFCIPASFSKSAAVEYIMVGGYSEVTQKTKALEFSSV